MTAGSMAGVVTGVFRELVPDGVSDCPVTGTWRDVAGGPAGSHRPAEAARGWSAASRRGQNSGDLWFEAGMETGKGSKRGVSGMMGNCIP